MIVFGTDDRTTVVTRGRFHCPLCMTQQPYATKKIRRFFTLYWLPVFPFKQMGEYVECERCRGRFRSGVLEIGAQSGQIEQDAVFHRALRGAMLTMAITDENISQAELGVIERKMELSGISVSEAEIAAEIETMRKNPARIGEHLETVSPFLNDHGKESVIKAIFEVIMADGRASDEEMAVLKEAARALNMTPAHFSGVVNEITRDL